MMPKNQNLNDVVADVSQSVTSYCNTMSFSGAINIVVFQEEARFGSVEVICSENITMNGTTVNASNGPTGKLNLHNFIKGFSTQIAYRLVGWN